MAPFSPMSDLPDLTGRVAFISGATYVQVFMLIIVCM